MTGGTAAAAAFPRLVVAGLSGESGKTLVSLSLLLEARNRRTPVRAFKKGPDYIDAAWLGWAAQSPAHNLDTFLMGFPAARESFARHAVSDGLNVIEGNRGLFDGSDAHGTHSTSELAKALAAPVILVVDATKVTRTVSALVLGCQKLDPKLHIGGVILNQVAGRRHESIICQAVEADCGLPVLGTIPRCSTHSLLPARHLGLVTPYEHPSTSDLERDLLAFIDSHLDLDRLSALANSAPPLAPAPPVHSVASGPPAAIGYFHDSAFCFYYPENLDALRAAGATLTPVSPLTAAEIPAAVDAIYIGGGFPETHAARLSRNSGFLASLRERARQGLPVYAECGGLMVLSRAIHWQGSRFPMAGVLPFDVEVLPKPQGHGYVELITDRPNPFFATGTRLRGHEFHYSRIASQGELPATACAVSRGVGCSSARDAVVVDNVWAAYTHLHALATPEWASALVRAATSRQTPKPALQSVSD
ncbi:MAG TPA: cobyrinate a,c-diamide synthase [Bryobacteraceae bacterium]|nr:cobyrinate a,c-diamide synthase [Bryobacteraceae bacterium]